MCQQCQRFNQPCICNDWGSKSFQIAEHIVSLGEGMVALCPFPHSLVHLLICIFYNKPVNKCFPEFCEQFKEIGQIKLRKVETSIYRWWVRSVGKTTWGFWLASKLLGAVLWGGHSLSTEPSTFGIWYYLQGDMSEFSWIRGHPAGVHFCQIAFLLVGRNHHTFWVT